MEPGLRKTVVDLRNTEPQARGAHPLNRQYPQQPSSAISRRGAGAAGPDAEDVLF
jgi:hypothetical protein